MRTEETFQPVVELVLDQIIGLALPPVTCELGGVFNTLATRFRSMVLSVNGPRQAVRDGGGAWVDEYQNGYHDNQHQREAAPDAASGDLQIAA
jgi:hypothetical protein